MLRHIWACLTAIVLVLVGCTGSDTLSRRTAEPISLQVLRVDPQLRNQRFTVLLDFEKDTQRAVVSASDLAFDRSVPAHTGNASLHLPDSAPALAVDLPKILRGSRFPDEWSLAGAYIFVRHRTTVTIEYETAGRVIAHNTMMLQPGQWTLAAVDLTALVNPNATSVPIGRIVFRFSSPPVDGIWLDDVVLIDNTQTLQSPDPRAIKSGRSWCLRQRGFHIVGENPGRFRFTLLTCQASSEGWKLEEVNEIRARFSSQGTTRCLTIYSNGRAYWDGEFRPLRAKSDVQTVSTEQHETPAIIGVPNELGQIDRNIPGDLNNDGYNELTGVYQLIARGSRLELTITPQTSVLEEPVLEISNLPPGKLQVTVDGQLLGQGVRLSDSCVLLELPVRIVHSTAVSIKVQ